MRLHLDYETASTVNLKQAGAYKYAAHPDTRILMLGWAVDDDNPELWQPHLQPKPPSPLVDALRDPNINKHAFNAAFERLITKYKLDLNIPAQKWRCTMVEAFYLGFTGGLDAVLKAIGLEPKDDRGKRLINLFSTPAPKNHKADWYDWTNRPGEWEEFCQYCLQDLKVERKLWHWMQRFPTMQDWDWRQWCLDQDINDRGVLLDVEMARAAISIWAQEKANIKEEMEELTGLPKVTRGPFLEYLQDTFGVQLENLTKDYLAAQLKKGELPAGAADLVRLWGEKEAKAVSKYTSITRVAGEGNRARGMFQYKGAARTDRVGGRLLQLQNLKRPFSDRPQQVVDAIKLDSPDMLRMIYPQSVSETLGGAIRHAITAPPGKSLVVADLSSIESVVLGWLAKCPLIDETFRSGRDSYKVFASKYYGVPYEDVTKTMRGFSKPPVLGCGYMLGWKGLIAYAEGYGVDMSEEDARRAVDTFRTMYPEIPAFWSWVYDAIKYVTTTGREVEGYRMRIERDRDFLRVWLPSGRALSYYKPEIREMPAPWDREKTILNFTYMGTNDKNQWCRISAHAGGVTENFVQSIAGDILWHGITNATNEDLNVVLHVHDEIACEEYDHKAERSLKLLEECMTRTLPWAPDMWLGADGFITKRYTKD